MAKIVIDLDDTIYGAIKYRCYLSEPQGLLKTLCDAIEKGQVLPKGYGRLGDLDKLEKDMQNYHDDCAKTSEYTRLGFETAIAAVEDANTIIEADTAESEGE